LVVLVTTAPDEPDGRESAGGSADPEQPAAARAATATATTPRREAPNSTTRR
jgi:hypothetical protein